MSIFKGKQKTEADKAFDQLGPDVEKKIRENTGSVFHKKLEEGGYLNEKGVFTLERELDFLADRKVIVIHRKTLNGKVNSADYSIVASAMPYYNAYKRILANYSDWKSRMAYGVKMEAFRLDEVAASMQVDQQE